MREGRLSELKRWFVNLNLSQQFRLVSFVIVAINMLGIGWWIGEHIERRVIQQTATTTALYVDSFIAPHLQNLGTTVSLTPAQMQRLGWQMANTPLGQRIVAFKVWNAQGRIVYSTNPSLIDQRFPLQGGLAQAWQGEVVSTVSRLNRAENAQERQHWSELLETYSPVRRHGTQAIIAVVEFYQTVDELKRGVWAAKWQGWLIVGVATGFMYCLLASIVHRGSETIKTQQATLQEHVAHLTDLLRQNQALHERIRRAATRTTALNERFLRRISAELHDGPAQMLSFALLQLDTVMAHSAPCSACHAEAQQSISLLETIQTALQQTLEEMRTIAKGLRLPALNNLPFAEVVLRAIREHERRTCSQVHLTCERLPTHAPLSTKITLYRVLQEALSNAYRHGKGVNQQVRVVAKSGWMQAWISDQGPGFHWSAALAHGDHLGLVGMRERVESLGGQFCIDTAPNRGTTVMVRLSLSTEEEVYE